MQVKSLLPYKNGEMGKYVFGLVLVIMMMSCGEDIDLFIPRANQNVSSDITRLTSKLKQDIAGDIHYTVSCPCFGGQAFEFDKDLVLVVPPAFVDIQQYPCPNSGTYDLDVTVCDTKGEILMAGIPTVSEHKFLESRIEFNIQIKDGDHVIHMAPHKQLRVLVNDPDPRERMELFYGGDDREWIQADGNPDTWDNVNPKNGGSSRIAQAVDPLPDLVTNVSVTVLIGSILMFFSMYRKISALLFALNYLKVLPMRMLQFSWCSEITRV